MTPEESQIYYKNYYEKNKERVNKTALKYYYANIDKMKEYYKEYNKIYYAKNREKRLAYQREYYKLNGCKYYNENKEVILQKKREKYQASIIKSSCQKQTNKIIKNIEKEKEKAEAFKATLCHSP